MRREMRSLLTRVVRRGIRPVLDEWMRSEAIHANPHVAGKLYSAADAAAEHIELRDAAPRTDSDDSIPVPPAHLWHRYASTAEELLAGARADVATMTSILSQAGASADELERVLDFGCAAARMLRFFPRSRRSELWGVDVSAAHINWCQTAFGPPFNFATTTTAPHLPFEDDHFDLVYASSVFTHISDLADAWFLELRRVVRRGGYLYITIHDKRTLDVLLTKYRDHPLFAELVDLVQSFCARTGVRSQDYAYFTILADPVSQVFYDEEYLTQKWSRWAEVVSLTPEAHDHQSALLLRK